MPNFNVLTQPWIPIEDLNGQSKLLGILDLLKRAHEIRCVNAASPLVSYGIQRMLIAFLIDAFRPEDIDSLAELNAERRFDTSVLDGYVSKCLKNGECFDLFDESRPFLQSAIDEKLDKEKEITYVTKLFLELPAGNNHTHFQHTMEKEYLFTPAECAQVLCAVSPFATNYGTNAYFSVNGSPPIYCLYSGGNLFEILSASMIAQSEHREMTLDSPPVAWCNPAMVKKAEKIAKTSLLYGLTCQPRRITMIPMETDKGTFVKKMYYAKGWDFKEISNWTDPHVVYIQSKANTRTSLKPREGRAMWRDLGSILSANPPPKLLNQIMEKLNMNLESEPLISVNTYGLVGEYKGPVFAVNSWFEESLSIDLRLVENETKALFVNEVLILVEDINNVLRTTLRQSINQLKGKNSSMKERSRYANLAGQAETLYFSKVKDYILGDFCSLVAGIEASKSEWEITIKKQTGKLLFQFAEDAFNAIGNGLGSSAKTLEWRAIAEKAFRRNIYKKLKGGWLDE